MDTSKPVSEWSDNEVRAFFMAAPEVARAYRFDKAAAGLHINSLAFGFAREWIANHQKTASGDSSAPSDQTAKVEPLRVRCIEGAGRALIVGTVYTVDSESSCYYYLREIGGGWDKYRFAVFQPQRDPSATRDARRLSDFPKATPGIYADEHWQAVTLPRKPREMPHPLLRESQYDGIGRWVRPAPVEG